MDAWVDCLGYLPVGNDNMSHFQLAEGEQLFIHVPMFGSFSKRVPEVCSEFLECTAIVNQRYLVAGDCPRLVLVLE